MKGIVPSRVWTDPRLLAWTVLTVGLSPLLLLAKLKRHFLQGYEWEFEPRRWRVPVLTPDVPTAEVVFVGAGPGELMMIDRLVEALEERRPGLRIGICLRNLDTLAELQETRPGRRLSVWPFDALPPVARWLREERPGTVVFVDRFRFPTLACAATRAGSRLVLVNGRSRNRRSLGYRIAAPFYRWQMRGFRLMAMQSEGYAAAARCFAPLECQILHAGSLKADLRPRVLDEAQRESLARWLLADGVPLVAVGSTTDVEEEVLAIDAFLEVRAKVSCRLLLAPRDVRRLDETLGLLEVKGLGVSRRSVGGPPGDVLLLDTFGELATAYGFCRAAYVGGFRGKGGGHNVLEPLEHRVPVAYGPNPGHFEAERRLIESSGAGTRVDDAEGLIAFWLRFLENEAEREQVGLLGKSILDSNRGAVGRTADALLRVIDG